MIKHRINTVSRDCWWTPHIYSGFWASFNVLFCLDDPFVSRNWIIDKLAEIFPHFSYLPRFLHSSEATSFLPYFVNQVILAGHRGLGFWEKILSCMWLWTIILRNFWNPFQNALIFVTLFCSASLTHFEIQLRNQCCSQRPFKNSPGMPACYMFSLWRNKLTKFIKTHSVL